MNPTTEAHTRAPIGETLPDTPDELYVYLWRLHSAIRQTYLMSAAITAMALKQETEIVHSLWLLLDMDEYQRSLVTSKELIDKLNKTINRNRKIKQSKKAPIKVYPEKQKLGLMSKLVSYLKGGSL